MTTFVVFHFALNRTSVEGDLAAGILWVTLLFAAMLGVNRLFVADAEQGGFDGFLLAPSTAARCCSPRRSTLLAYLVVLELVAVPAFALLLLGPRSATRCRTCCWRARARPTSASRSIGTLVGGARGATRARDLLGPLLALPLLVPIVIGGRARQLAAAASATHAGPLRRAGWLTLGAL